MEAENRKTKTKIYALERKVAELEEINKEVKEKMLKNHKEYKIAKQEWMLKETEIMNELNSCRITNQQLLVEQMKIGNEDAVKNIVLPMGSSSSPVNRLKSSNLNASITLPYIDLKSQSKKIILNLSSSDFSSQIIPPTVPELVLPGSLSFSSQTVPNTAVSVPSTVPHPPQTSGTINSPLRSSLQMISGNNLGAPGSPNGAAQVLTIEHTQPHSNSNTPPRFLKTSSSSNFKEIYMDVFTKGPTPMILLSRNYRIWRVNNKFCDLLECDEQSLLGLTLSDISLGVELDTLPRLLQFDIVQGLAVCKPNEKSNNPISHTGDGDELTASLNSVSNLKSLKQKKKKTFVKVNIHISVLGTVGEKYQVAKSTTQRPLKAPMYALAFTKIKK